MRPSPAPRRRWINWAAGVPAAVLWLALAGCGGGDDDTTLAPFSVTYAAPMSGEQEVANTPTGALGTGSLTITKPSLAIEGSIKLDGMTATAAHIHMGDAGSNGAVIVPLVQSATDASTWSVPAGTVLTTAQADALAAGGLYFNAHSSEFPAGEVRGQIGRQVFNTRLAGAQENPGNASVASGTGFVSVDPSTNRYVARITVTGLAATAAHIHTGAVGVNGGVAVGLAETAAGSGVWASPADGILTDVQAAALRDGTLYFNAHTTAFPGGEIRGQIGRLVGYATLNGAQEVPAVVSAATGTGRVVIDPATRAISGGIQLTGLTATAAHIHLAAAGVNGPVAMGLVSAGAGAWNLPAGSVLTAAQLKAFKQGNLYFNAHSAAFAGGEIRGQIR